MKTPKKHISDDVLLQILDEHELWIRSGFTKGHRANFANHDLSGKNLSHRNLSGAHFYSASLRNGNLTNTIFYGNRLALVDMTGAVMYDTVFRRVSLDHVNGLEEVIHTGPSTIGTDTIYRSKGNIPASFLRGCGLSDIDIEYAKLSNPYLNNEEINKILYKIYDLRANQALQISPLFISYSHGDGSFVDKIESQLNKKGIRFWRDIHNMKAGRIEKQIDNAISQNRTVLLVLSEHSLSSDWVEHEVRMARGVEKELGRDVLCPIALDDSWKSSPWPARVMEQIMEYNILDFSAWEDDGQFEGMFRKLIDGLELFYKDKSHGE